MTRKTAASHVMTAVAFILCTFLSTSTVYAQNNGAEGLEQTYARLCGNGQNSEACTALRTALMAKLSGQAQNATTQGVTTAVTAGTTLPPAGVPVDESEAAVDGVWGFYSRLAGHKWVTEQNGQRAIENFDWVERGRVLRRSVRWLASTQMQESTIEIDSVRGRVLTREPVYKLAYEIHRIEPDGSLVLTHLGGSAARLDARWEVVDNTHLRYVIVRKDATGKTDTIVSTIPFVRITASNEQALGQTAEEQALAVDFQRLLAQVVARQAAADSAAANARRSGGGGLLRAAIGAGLGLAAANAGGMDAAQTLGAAAKGVALMNPESQVAQVIGASGDAVLQNSGLGTAPAGTTSAGSSSASYPTKPNLLNGQAACSMMNESNYRQVGVSGGSDAQLKTMCAQAYEYYTMYKRAIAQGYAEADANRTYAAHEQSARVAISFHAGAR